MRQENSKYQNYLFADSYDFDMDSDLDADIFGIDMDLDPAGFGQGNRREGSIIDRAVL